MKRYTSALEVQDPVEQAGEIHGTAETSVHTAKKLSWWEMMETPTTAKQRRKRKSPSWQISDASYGHDVGGSGEESDEESDKESDEDPVPSSKRRKLGQQSARVVSLPLLGPIHGTA